jgi:hypothetical protein
MLRHRLATEKTIVKAMIEIYCKANHNAVRMCEDCNKLIEYALLRTEKCRYQENKPACKRCPTHCYNIENRNKIKEIMRFSRKKILLKHPILSVKHVINRFN